MLAAPTYSEKDKCNSLMPRMSKLKFASGKEIGQYALNNKCAVFEMNQLQKLEIKKEAAAFAAGTEIQQSQELLWPNTIFYIHMSQLSL